MGTRADFYIGKGVDATWIGSIAWDGYRDGIDEAILSATTETQFVDAVKKFFSERRDVTLPEHGWPWPWETSAITDCSYWFFDDQVWDEVSGKYAPMSFKADEYGEIPEGVELDSITFPVFNTENSASAGSERSGVICVSC